MSNKDRLVEELIAVLGVGEENATPARALEDEIFGDWQTSTSYRIRELAREANLAGHPVVSGQGGFWLAGSFEEIRAYEQSLISRAMAILERARALATVTPAGVLC